MFRLFAFLLLAFPLATYAESAPRKLTVIASFSIIADMAREIAGDAATIETLVPAGGDVHVYDPSPRDARAVAVADLILINGLGFEGWMERLLASAGAKGRVVTVSKGVTPITLKDAEIDPHAWQDIANGIIYAGVIRDALSAADPAHAALYRQNAKRYIASLGMLDAWVKSELQKIPPGRRRAITSHDALRYFARAYAIDFIPAQGLSTEGSLSAATMAGLIDQIRKEKVNAVFLENMGNPDLIRGLAEDSGATIGGILYSDSLSDASGDAATYIAMFRHNVSVLSEALRK